MAVHWMLIELDVPFDLLRVDLSAPRSSEHLAANPLGRVPTLLIEGQPISECAAILLLLAERHPEAEFACPIGAPGRADYIELMVTLANGLLPAFRGWFYPDDLVSARAREDLQAHLQDQIFATWARLDDRLSDRRFILGDRMTSPDFLLTMLARWSRNMTRPAESWPNLRRYIRDMRLRPGLIEVHAREGLSEWIAA